MKTDKPRFVLAFIALAVLVVVGIHSAVAQTTAFTYQGFLTDSGAPANGVYDLTFTLFNAASGGATVGASNVVGDLSVTNGIFTVTLDYGTGAFDGSARWLQINVRPGVSVGTYTILSPRPALLATPYAIRAATATIAVTSSNVIANAVTGAGIAKPLSLSGSGPNLLSVTSSDDTAASFAGGAGGYGLAASGGLGGVSGISTSGYGVYGQTATIIGVYGYSSGTGEGVHGTSVSGDGVYGGGKNGVHGRSSSASDSGVWGDNSGGGYGVVGTSDASGGRGVYGRGQDKGVYGLTPTAGPTHAGVFGENSAVGGTAVVGNALAANSAGVAGIGDTSGSTGVYGRGTAIGVSGSSTTGDAIYGSGKNGVHGVSSSSTDSGVWGEDSGGGYGVVGTSDGGGGPGQGVYGRGRLVGVYGTGLTGTGDGVQGWATPTSSSGNIQGVHGVVQGAVDTSSNSSVAAVLGECRIDGGTAIEGAVDPGYLGAYAGRFYGNVQMYNNLTVSGTKSFKIDHPLDPANKYLLHSCVESPDVKNIYDGNVTTDENGAATVKLPDYFEVLNRDFRYQLTVIGQFAHAIIGTEIEKNQFTIRTDSPNVKVSWQVTGIRQDAWVKANPMVVEQDKPQNQRGTYVHPELFGQPEEKGLAWVQRPGMLKRMREDETKRSAAKGVGQ